MSKCLDIACLSSGSICNNFASSPRGLFFMNRESCGHRRDLRSDVVIRSKSEGNSHMKQPQCLKQELLCSLSKKMPLGSSVFLLTFLHPTSCDFLLYLGKRKLCLTLESVPFLSVRERTAVTTWVSTALFCPADFTLCQQ